MMTKAEQLVERGFREALFRYYRDRPGGVPEWLPHQSATSPAPHEPTVMRPSEYGVPDAAPALAHFHGSLACITERRRGETFWCKCGRVIYDDRH